MTGPAQPAPGWYPDPDGAAGMVRWWNGVELVRRRHPRRPRAWPCSPRRSWRRRCRPAAPAFQPPAPQARPAARRGSLGLSLLVLVAVVGRGARSLGNSGGTATPAAVPDGRRRRSSPPAGPTFPPGTLRIIDDVSGISYPYLGTGWNEWTLWHAGGDDRHGRPVLHDPGGHARTARRSSPSARRGRWPTASAGPAPRPAVDRSRPSPTRSACSTTRARTSGR